MRVSLALPARQAACGVCRPARHAVARAAGRATYVTRASAAANASKLVAADKKQLGDSDLMVSVCCLGTMTWGSQNTEQEAHEQLSYSLDMGVNFMDAAEVYPVPVKQEYATRTEQYIGTWLKNQNRSNIVLATKVAGRSPTLGYLRGDGRGLRVDRSNILEAVEGSLRRLQTDHIDLLQIHWPDRYVPLFGGGTYDPKNNYPDEVPFEEQLEAFHTLVQQGKVRHIGVSNETSYGVMRFTQAAAAGGLPKIVSIQNAYSLLVRGPFEADLAETCAPRNCNVGLLAYSPLAGGVLTGKYVQGRFDDKSRLLNWRSVYGEGFMDRYNKGIAREATEKYLQVAEKHGLTLTQLALGWCKSRWFVASSIIGATTMEQLRENLEAFNTELSEECISDINEVYRVYRDPATTPK